jgi:hypothetical protein
MLAVPVGVEGIEMESEEHLIAIYVQMVLAITIGSELKSPVTFDNLPWRYA